MANHHQRGQGVPMPLAAYQAQSTRAGAFFLGSPQEVTDKILDQWELFHHDRVTIQMGFGNVPQREMLRSIELLGTEVAPKALAELIISRLAAHADISAEVIEIHALTPGLGAAVEREQLDERTEAAIRAIESADLLIAATPVFRGSYSGLFKHFFDFVGQYALAGSRCCWSPPAAATGTRW